MVSRLVCLGGVGKKSGREPYFTPECDERSDPFSNLNSWSAGQPGESPRETLENVFCAEHFAYVKMIAFQHSLVLHGHP